MIVLPCSLEAEPASCISKPSWADQPKTSMIDANISLLRLILCKASIQLDLQQ